MIHLITVIQDLSASVPTLATDPPPTVSKIDDKEFCYLIHEEPAKHTVGEGHVYRNASVAHNMKIDKNRLKVNVTYVRPRAKEKVVPFPTEEVKRLGDAKKCFILWPRELVSDIPAVCYFLDVSL